MMKPNQNKQKGFVLVVSLIFLVLMTLLAITSIRKATLDEKVVGNLRTRELAFEAAEKALRFCDAKIYLVAGAKDICTPKPGTPIAKVFTDPEPPVDTNATANFPSKWRTASNWTDANTFTLSGDDVLSGVAEQPKCMIERWQLGSTAARFPYVITARGVGAVSSNVVILQEIVRCGNS